MERSSSIWAFDSSLAALYDEFAIMSSWPDWAKTPLIESGRNSSGMPGPRYFSKASTLLTPSTFSISPTRRSFSGRGRLEDIRMKCEQVILYSLLSFSFATMEGRSFGRDSMML